MELLKMFIKDNVPAVGLSKFRDKKEERLTSVPQRLNLNKRTFRPNYNNNFYLA